MMLPDGTPKDDVKVPEGQIGNDIEAAFEKGSEVTVTIIAAMGESREITIARPLQNLIWLIPVLLFRSRSRLQVRSRPSPSRRPPPRRDRIPSSRLRVHLSNLYTCHMIHLQPEIARITFFSSLLYLFWMRLSYWKCK